MQRHDATLLNPMVHIINSDFFGVNKLPFAAYIDSQWSLLETYKAPRLTHYERYTPQALSAACSQYSSIKNPFRWGQNRATSHGATWTTETYKGICTGAAGRQFAGRAISEKDILRALTRRSVFGVGRSDAEVDVSELAYAKWNPFEWPDEVSCLIVDIDMDAAWAKKDLSAVRREVWLEREVIRLLNLPCRFLKTGGRGHQMIIPFPCPASRSTASWLARVIASLLTPLQEIGQAHCDCTNVDGIVRLAEGRHAKTSDLALFFDPDTLTPYPIEQQVALLSSAYRWSGCPQETKDAFKEALEEVTFYLHEEQGIAPGEALEPKEVIWDVATDLPDNDFVKVVRGACETMLHDLPVPAGFRYTEQRQPEKPAKCESDSMGASAAAINRAAAIWSTAYTPGGSWAWLTTGDGQGRGNGVWAAFVLFGDEGAERQLLTQAEEIGASALVALRERRATIRSLCQSHLEKRDQSGTMFCPPPGLEANTSIAKPIYQEAENMITGTLTTEMEVMIEKAINHIIRERAGREAGRKAAFQARQLQLLRRIISVLVLGLSQSAYLSVSRRTLAASIAALWPDVKAINHNTLQNNLALLIEGNPACLFPLLRPSPLVVRAMTLRGIEEQSVDAPNSISRFVAGDGLEI